MTRAATDAAAVGVGQREILTQQRVLRFFDKTLKYKYLGNWKDRDGNRNVEEELLRDWLDRQGHEERIINHALRELDQAAAISGSKTFFDANRAVHGLLRYGVKVKPSVEEQTVTAWLIDWNNRRTTTSPWPRRSRWWAPTPSAPMWCCT